VDALSRGVIGHPEAELEDGGRIKLEPDPADNLSQKTKIRRLG